LLLLLLLLLVVALPREHLKEEAWLYAGPATGAKETERQAAFFVS
jgi:hypothetical protein